MSDEAEILSIDGREVRVTHPEKLYFSKQVKVSKLDLVRYYLSGCAGGVAGDSRSAHRAEAIRKWC